MNNLNLMKNRLTYQGGNQEERMIKDKYRTFQKTLSYSYQGVDVQKEGEEEIRRALINPDKNSTNYDDKILSIDYSYGFKPGDIFTWVGTESQWLVYLPELTEDAYFRSQIRRCRYKISWLGKEIKKGYKNKYTSFAYVRGPVETKINFTSEAGLIIDNPNYSLEIYLPNTEAAKEHFKRYQRFSFDNSVWEVQSVDSISIEGVLQIIALENFENGVLDDLDHQKTSDGEKITDAFYIDPYIDSNLKDDRQKILGESFIKPLGDFTYSLSKGVPVKGKWSVLEKNYPVTLTPTPFGVTVHWNNAKSGQFTLVYQTGELSYQRVIVVESLF